MVGNFILYWIVLLFCVNHTNQSPLNPDKKKMFQDIVSNKGLYSVYDKVHVLNNTNFEEKLFKSIPRKSWVVEFYNSWCGHCIGFAPHWKSLARNIKGWSNLVRIGAVDCSSENNKKLCSDQVISHYPEIKFFPSTSSNFSGLAVPPNVVGRSVTALRLLIVFLLKENELLSNVTTYLKKEEVPKLEEEHLAVGVIEAPNSLLGSQLALDTIDTDLRIFILDGNSTFENLSGTGNFTTPKFFFYTNSLWEEIKVEHFQRETIYSAIREFLKDKNMFLPTLLDDESQETSWEYNPLDLWEFMQLENNVKDKLNTGEGGIVFQLDLEKALKHTLNHEIPSKKEIVGEAMNALKSYLRIVSNYFPFSAPGKRYLNYIEMNVSNKSEISGSYFEELVLKAEAQARGPIYLEPSGWIGCRGTLPHLRGFPCGLWMVFHTLTVHYPTSNPTHSPNEVLKAILGYVKHFFGCTDCSEHFQKMAETIDSSVETADDMVLWLWEAHNSVNHRLRGDPKTEDPSHPKVPFPTPLLCPPPCSTSDPNQTFSQPLVLSFLRFMYSNISYTLLPAGTIEEALSPTISSIPLLASSSFQISHSLTIYVVFVYCFLAYFNTVSKFYLPGYLML